MKLRGSIYIGPDCPGFAQARLRIILEDSSRADAPAETLAVQDVALSGVATEESANIPFELEAPEARPGLNLRAHVAMHAGSDIQIGDLISTEAVPAQDGNAHLIRVQPVG